MPSLRLDRSARLALAALLALALLAPACADDEPDPATGGVTNNGGTNNGPNNGNNGPNNGNNDPNNGNNNGGANGAPELTKIGSKRAQVGTQLSFVVMATDPDGDTLNYSVFGELPAGAKFDKETHTFSWTPVAEQVGAFTILTFAVTDGDLDDRETIQIEVVNAGGNAPPELTDPGDQLLRVDTHFTLQLEATDPDGDTLAYRIDGSGPNGAELDKDTGAFTWTPAAADEGASFPVLFVVSDGEDEASVTVRLLVSELMLTLGDIPNRTVRLGERLEFALPIDNPQALPLECSIIGAAPAGTHVDTAQCVFSWTPTDASLVGRTVEVTFKVIADNDGEPVTLVGTGQITVQPAATTNNGGTNNGETPCDPDAAEPNDDRATAFAVTAPLTDLQICGADVDWFSLQATQGQTIAVTATFRHADGDIDLALYQGSSTTPLQLSDSVTDDEAVTAEAPATDTYRIRVWGFQDTRNTYDLTVDVATDNACTDDAAEPNDTNATATIVPAGHTDSYVICPSDADWFAVDVQSGEQLSVAIAFGDTIDIDLDVIGPNGRLWSSRGIDPFEEVVVDPTPVGGRYLIHVYGFLQDSGEYLLEVDVSPSTACLPDGLEPNDTLADALPLASDEQLDALTACGTDADWFQYTLPAEGVLFAILDGTGVTTMRLRALADDGVTVLGTSTVVNGTLELELGPFTTGRDVYLVIDQGAGQLYNLGVVGL